MNPDKISHFFDTQFPINKDGLEDFVRSFEIKSYKKGDVILENGSLENELRFLDNGIIREYYASNDKEKNINFYTESGFITDFSSFLENNKTKKKSRMFDRCTIKNFEKKIIFTFFK